LLARDDVRHGIARLRAKADEVKGSAVLSLVDRRRFLARVVRARPGMLEVDSDLWQKVRITKRGVMLRLPDKVTAIKLDSRLAGRNRKENEEIQRQEASILAHLAHVRESYPRWQKWMEEMRKTNLDRWDVVPRVAKAKPAEAGATGAANGVPVAEKDEAAEMTGPSFAGEAMREAVPSSSFSEALARSPDEFTNAPTPGQSGGDARQSVDARDGGGTHEPDAEPDVAGPSQFAHHAVLRPPGSIPNVCGGIRLMRKMAPGRGTLPLICRSG